jgi:hypothetical protein
MRYQAALIPGIGQGCPPTMSDLATYAEASFAILRCGRGDPLFNATFLVAPLMPHQKRGGTDLFYMLYLIHVMV